MPPSPLPFQYPEALKKNMNNTNLQFDMTCTNKNSEKNKKRKRKITWFTPPPSFLTLCGNKCCENHPYINQQTLPKDKRLSKIFNRNAIKVSYSCLLNVTQTISNNNHRLLQLHRMQESTQDIKLCNCRSKYPYPVHGKCLTKCVVYKGAVTETNSNNEETYIGLTQNEFRTRFNLHKSSFKLEHKMRTSTTLSDHVWKLKNKNVNLNIKWEVVT